MICKNCECEVQETEQFCPKCGCRLRENTEENQKEAAVQSEEEKKGRFSLIWKLLIFAVIIIIVVLTALAMAGLEISNLFRRIFYSPEKYYAYVEEQACMESVESLTVFYENAVKNRDMRNLGTHGEIEIKLEKGTIVMLEKWVEYPDFSWLENVKLTTDFSSKNNLLRGNGELTVGKPVAVMEAVLNMDSAKAYFALPEWSSSYMGIKNLEEKWNMESTLAEEYEKVLAMYEAYPDKKTLDETARKYIKLILANVDEVKKRTDILEAEGISQKCTVLEVHLDRDDIHAMAEAVLQEASDEQELKDILVDFAEAIDKLPNTDMKVWVDDKGRIRGREVTVGKEKVFSYAMPLKKEEYGYRMKAGPMQEYSVEGKGIYSPKDVNGEFKIYAEGQSVKIRVNKFDLEKYREGCLDGVFEIQIPGGQVDMVLDCGKEKAEISLTAYLGSKTLGTVRILSAYQDGEEIKEPEEKDVIWIEDDSDLEEWLKTVDAEGFLEHLREANIPTELVDMWEEYIGYYYYF